VLQQFPNFVAIQFERVTAHGILQLQHTVYYSYSTRYITVTAHGILQLQHTAYYSYSTRYITVTAHGILQLQHKVYYSYSTRYITVTAHGILQLQHTVYYSYNFQPRGLNLPCSEFDVIWFGRILQHRVILYLLLTYLLRGAESFLRS